MYAALSVKKFMFIIHDIRKCYLICTETYMLISQLSR